MIEFIINTANSVIYLLSHAKDIVYVLFHEKLSKNKDESLECVVVGNGPSLKKTLENKISFFENKKTMCVNGFVYSKFFGKIHPAYYLLIDPDYWAKKMSRDNMDNCTKIRKILNKNVTWPLTIFLPLVAKDSNPFRNLPRTNKNIRIHYFILSEVVGPKFFRDFLLFHNLGVPPGGNVAVAGIFLFLNMGYKKIYIVGADHSWHEDLKMGENNTLFLKDRHFFDKKGARITLLYKDAEKSNKNVFNISETFAIWSHLFFGYIELEKYSKQLGAKIYNASEKSYIDAFSRYKIVKN